MICPNCDTTGLSIQAEACPKCGHPLKKASPASIVTKESDVRIKNKNLTVILALFLGGVGVHRFYLGNIGLGFLYLLFCWTSIPMWLGLFEAGYFAFMKHDKFDRDYNDGIVTDPRFFK